MVVFNRNVLFQWSIFRGYFSFREGTTRGASSISPSQHFWMTQPLFLHETNPEVAELLETQWKELEIWILDIPVSSLLQLIQHAFVSSASYLDILEEVSPLQNMLTFLLLKWDDIQAALRMLWLEVVETRNVAPRRPEVHGKLHDQNVSFLSHPEKKETNNTYQWRSI